MSGTTRETVTRALKQLQRDGYIRVEGRRLYILPDPGGGDAGSEAES